MANVSDLINKIRILVKDTGSKSYSDYELLSYFNDACDFLSMELISQRDDAMIKKLTLTSGANIPDIFVEFAGQYPVYIEGATVNINEPGVTTIDVRCWCKYPTLAMTDTLPFRSMYNMPVAQLAAVYAKSRDAGGIPQDEKEIDYIRNNIAMIRQKRQAATQLPSEA